MSAEILSHSQEDIKLVMVSKVALEKKNINLREVVGRSLIKRKVKYVIAMITFEL